MVSPKRQHTNVDAPRKYINGGLRHSKFSKPRLLTQLDRTPWKDRHGDVKVTTPADPEKLKAWKEANATQ